MKEKILEMIEDFYIEYYDILPQEGHDEIKAELSKSEHRLDTVLKLLNKSIDWESRHFKAEAIGVFSSVISADISDD